MDQENESISPRNNPFLIGHEDEEKFILDAFKNNSLHNSWLISGVEGIGKATFAYKLARYILKDDKGLVASNSHPDMKVIERDYIEAEKKKIIKAIKDGEPLDDDELKSMKKSAVIRVDDVRTINEFLSKRASYDGWRVVLIDSIDEMNQSSANAVLKILEEPPYKTLILLISHNPNKLLPTIKSRCAKLNLKPLNEANVSSLLRRYRPDVKEAEIKTIVKICSGSIGKAISYVDNQAVKRYDDLCKIIYAKDKFSINDMIDFCSNDESYELSKDLILKFISDNIKSSENVDELAAAWDKATKTFSETEALNMDKKQALMNILNNLCKVI